MKNLLIPTILDSDTVNAVKVAVNQLKNDGSTIYLMLVAEIPDTYSSAAFVREMKSELSVSQLEVLEAIRCVTDNHRNCRLKIHHQYGISAPLIRNLIAHFGIGLTIVTPSYKKAEKKIHQLCLQVLSNGKCPMLHLSADFKAPDFDKAMFLEYNQSKIQAVDLKLIQDEFSFNIVSQAKLYEEQPSEEIVPILADAISRNNINLLVETRKPAKITGMKKERNAINDMLGIPVLSLYEELA